MHTERLPAGELTQGYCEMITQKAHAKINLTLEVLGKRDDGYHEIATIMQTIDLADLFTFEEAEELNVYCPYAEGINRELIINTIRKSIETLRRETGCTRGCDVRMETIDIPRAAGLGSSATDSAAVLKGLNLLWGLNINTGDLEQIAAKLGSDTPFFIRGGTALAEGRGECITPLPSTDPFRLVILNPHVPCLHNKTAQMYSTLSTENFSTGKTTNEMMIQLLYRSRIDPGRFFNTFESVASEVVPQLSTYWQKFIEAGAKRVHLAGAGPAMFTLPEDETTENSIIEGLACRGIECLVTCTV